MAYTLIFCVAVITLKMAVLWKLHCVFWALIIALMMEAVISSETSVCTYQNAWCNIPEDSHCYTRHCENLTSSRVSCIIHFPIKFQSYISDVMEQALSVGFSTAEDYRDLWLGYIDYMRRRVDWNTEPQSTELAELRGVFNRACDHLAQCE